MNSFTAEELAAYELLLQPQPERVIFMSPRAIEAYDWHTRARWEMTAKRKRNYTEFEWRWETAKHYKQRCEPRTVERIPFPEES